MASPAGVAVAVAAVVGALVLFTRKKKRPAMAVPPQQIPPRIFTIEDPDTGNKVQVPCPTRNELAKWDAENPFIVEVVPSRTSIPFATATQFITSRASNAGVTVEQYADSFVYFVEDECRFYAYDVDVSQFTAEWGAGVWGDFFDWRYIPGWLDEVRAGRVPTPRSSGMPTGTVRV